ncbi:MAG: Maf family protein [Rhodospirillaceae bacterium]
MTYLVLASASTARRAMLVQAGLEFVCEAASIDEAALKCSGVASGLGAVDIAEALARQKALWVAKRHPGALVIGADQMLVCGADWFDKPDSVAAARLQLQALCGHTHILMSSAVVVRDSEVIWSHSGQARLTMRRFSSVFLEEYLATIGPEVCDTVGGYRVEGLGVQLFDSVDGDHYVILGLPLLPLLEFLRYQGVLRI